MRDYLSLAVNGKPMRVGGAEAMLTAAEFLRRSRQLTGTKVVCAEGDCGACAVLVGKPAGGAMRYSAVNACILMMFQLDGCHLVSVEGLREGKSLNPIQEAMVKCHGTQCGYCTPGFVVSLFDVLGKSGDAEAVRRGLVGNLCRCTGYDSILRAALEVDRSKLKSVDELYPAGPLLEVLAAARGEELLIPTHNGRVFKPVTLGAALDFLEGGACIVSGATDIGVQRNKRTREISAVLCTAGLAELEGISAEAGSIVVGANATLSSLEEFTAERLAELSRYLEIFGSPLIRNGATVAGNLANASPIGDLIPPLMVLEAQIELAGTKGRRWVNINEFYTGYRQTALRHGEMIVGVRIHLPAAEDEFRLYKVSRRKDLDISTFNAAVWLRRQNGAIGEIRIALGGVGPVVQRLAATEKFLAGRSVSLETFEQAGQIAREEIKPISDVRGSEDYRRILARNILVKFWHEAGVKA